MNVSTASDPFTESGGTGRFWISRNAASTTALTVNYVMEGTAANGVDYGFLPGEIVIPAGTQATAGVAVLLTPINDTLPEGTETVTLRLAPGGYGIGVPSATHYLADNDALPLQVGFATFEGSGPEEKFFGGTASANGYIDPDGPWYYMLPNGDLFEFTPPYSNPELSGVRLAQLGSVYYEYPTLLPYKLFQRGASYFTNYRGQDEKYLGGRISASGHNDPDGYWYFLLSTGGLYEYTPPYSNPALTASSWRNRGGTISRIHPH